MKRDNGAYEIQTLAMFVHGALSALHSLGLVYNLRRKNYFDAAIHGTALLYDMHSAIKHKNERLEYETKDI